MVRISHIQDKYHTAWLQGFCQPHNSSSAVIGEECVDSKSGLKGRCQSFFECSYALKRYEIPENCATSPDEELLLCCPSVTFKGHECVDLTARLDGRCQNLFECNYALKYRKKPKDYDDSTVCCPPVQLRISEKMCFNFFHHISYPFDTERSTSDYDYTEKNNDVQADNVAVGIKTVLRKYSHMAAIGFNRNNKPIWRCGGSVISPFFILSAAHCNKHKIYGPAKWVRIGELHLQNTTEDANHQDFWIVKSFVHPDYTSSSYYNDIALFKLKKEIIFGHDYQPACLHTTRNVPEIMEATNWRQIDFLEVSTSYLLKELNVIEYEICAQRYRDNRKLPNGVRDESQICAWDINRRDRCLSDFGGPLQYKYEGFGNVRGHYVVAGIASFGEECDLDYGTRVYTRISAYLDWIEEIVWEDEIEPETVTFVFTN